MKNQNIGINYLDYYIPEGQIEIANFVNSISEHSVPKTFKNKDEYSMFLEYVLNLESIRVENDLNDFQMIDKLLDKMFNSEVVKPEEINIIIVAQEQRDNQTENLGQYIQFCKKIKNAYIINITGNQCANIEVAIDTACKLLKSNIEYNNILIVASNKIEKLDERIIDTYSVYGDGAGVLLINRNAIIEVVDTNILCNGYFYDVNSNSDAGEIHSQHYLSCINNLLERNTLQPSSLNKVVFQNANPLLISQCLFSLGVKSEQFFDENLSKYGHIDCIDIIINLKDIYVNKNANDNLNILSFGVSFNGTYISTLFKI